MDKVPALLAVLCLAGLHAGESIAISGAWPGLPSARSAKKGKGAWKNNPAVSSSSNEFWSPEPGEALPMEDEEERERRPATVNLSSAMEATVGEAEMERQDRRWQTLVENCIPTGKDVCVKLAGPGATSNTACMVDVVDGCFGAPFPVRFTANKNTNLFLEETTGEAKSDCLYHYNVGTKRITVGGQRWYKGSVVEHLNGMRIQIPGAEERGDAKFTCQVFITPTGATATTAGSIKKEEDKIRAEEARVQEEEQTEQDRILQAKRDEAKKKADAEQLIVDQRDANVRKAFNKDEENRIEAVSAVGAA